MTEVRIHESTKALLADPSLGDKDIDSKIRSLLRTEYLHQLARHRRTEKLFGDKYGMSFDEFVHRRVTKEQNYSWDVEQDAMAWETAIGGILTVERKLHELRAISHE